MSARQRTQGSDMLTPDDVAEEIHPLHYAAAMGDKKTLTQWLLRKDEKINVLTRDAFGRTALVYAVVSGKQGCAEILLKNGAEVNAVDNEGRTALHWAAFHQQPKMVKILLAAQADTLAVDIEQRLCLHLCVSSANTKIFTMIAKAMGSKLDVNSQDKWGMTPLHWAAYHSSLEHVKLLIKSGAVLTVADREGKTPFHWVASSDNVEVARLLLQASLASSRDGSPPSVLNLQDKEGRTPLHLAVANGDVKMVVFLLQSGADIRIQDVHGRTALHWASHVGQAAIVTRLLQQGAEQFKILDLSQASALIYAAVEGRADCIKALLANPEIMDIPDGVGRTALMASTSKADEATVAALLEHCRTGQVDIFAADSVGTTAVHACAYYGHARLMTLLLKAGAKVDTVDRHGYPAVFYACEMGHVEVLRVLVAGKARLDFSDEEGRSLLHWATAGGHVGVCEVLLETKNIVPDLVDQGGRTPLHTAAYLGNAAIVRLLLARRASANTRDKMGISALHWAASTGSMECVEVLVKNGRAFPNHMEFHPARLTPLDYAVMAQHQGIASFLRENGALTIAEVKDYASTHIQSFWKGFRARTELAALWQRLYGASKKDVVTLPALKSSEDKKKGGRKSVTLADIMYKPNISRNNMRDVLKTHKTKTEVVTLPPLVPAPEPVSEPEPEEPPVAVVPEPVRVATPPAAPPTPPKAASPPPAPVVKAASPRPTPPTTPDRAARPAGSPLVMERSHVNGRVRRNETKRREDIRAKIKAAVVIQRAWRQYLTSRQATRKRVPRLTQPALPPPRKESVHEPALVPVAPSPRQPPSSHRHPIPSFRSHVKPHMSQFPNIDPSNPKHQIAALTIQLAWRRYARRLAVRARAHRGLALIFARRARRQAQQQQAYAPMPLVDQWRPMLSPVVRPPEFNLPSPAITSFNMAFDTYLTPLLHPVQRMNQRRHRMEEISRRAREVRDQIAELRLMTNNGGVGDDDDDDDLADSGEDGEAAAGIHVVQGSKVRAVEV